MVTINFTLIVEAVLFLLFLWGTTAFILRPTLKAMDERDASVETDLEQEQTDNEEAGVLEGRYAEGMAAIRRSSDEEFRKERRRALEAHAGTMAGERHKADEAVAGTREEALGQVESQRETYKTLAPDLARLLAEKLKIRGEAS